MTAVMQGRRDLAGWLAAAAVAAALFGSAAAAALRLAPGMAGIGPVEAVALDLSVGVVPLSAALPSSPPEAAALVAPEALRPPEPEPAPETVPELAAAPQVAPPDPLPAPLPMPEIAPALALPQAEAPPIMAAAPPPLPQVGEPPLDMAQSPRPVARPDLRPERREKAEAPRPAPPQPQEQPEAPAPETPRAAPAQPAGSDQAARPAQERRVAGGQSAARYGDAVMRQIARLRRQKAPERGTVTVGFEIRADGGLGRVAVVSSSGSAALDRVAVDHIRRAAPFPPPPEGTAVRFAFEFVGK